MAQKPATNSTQTPVECTPPRSGSLEQLREPERRLRRNLKSKRNVAARLRWSLFGKSVTETPYTAPQASDEPRPSFVAAAFATLFAVIIGGLVTVFVTVVVLETLHTKDGAVILAVVVAAVSLGGFIAIRLRRSILKS